jgi:uncharacterized protein
MMNMKKLLLLLTLFVAVRASAQIEKVVPSRPSPPRLVNDFTGTLTAQQSQELERKLVAYDDSTSNQIAVVILPTIDDYGIEDVGLKILRDWGVGGKKNNNGVVILIAKNDRKVRIEVGYGLEGAIPDVTARSIISHDIVPAFKQQNYYRGIDEAVTDIMKAAAGEYKAPQGYGSKKIKGKGGIGALAIFIIIIIIAIFGGRRGGGGGMVSRRGYGGFGAGWILGSLLSGGGSGGWSGGGGGGGGWSGGGGGFGGFGGGSGGGGGASGSW